MPSNIQATVAPGKMTSPRPSLYQFGNTFYCLVYEQGGVALNLNPVVMQSLDDGATWNQLGDTSFANYATTKVMNAVFAVDSIGTPHLVYGQYAGTGTVFNIYHSKYIAGAWTTPVLIKALTVLKYPTAIFDQGYIMASLIPHNTGLALAVFGKIDFHNFGVGFKTTGLWAFEFDGTNWDAGTQLRTGAGLADPYDDQRDPFLAADSADNLHLIFAGPPAGSTNRAGIKIRYRKKITTTWGTEEEAYPTAFHAVTSPPYFSDLKIDLTDLPHFALVLPPTNTELLHVYKTASWASETVVIDPLVIWDAGLLLPHIPGTPSLPYYQALLFTRSGPTTGTHYRTLDLQMEDPPSTNPNSAMIFYWATWNNNPGGGNMMYVYKVDGISFGSPITYTLVPKQAWIGQHSFSCYIVETPKPPRSLQGVQSIQGIHSLTF